MAVRPSHNSSLTGVIENDVAESLDTNIQPAVVDVKVGRVMCGGLFWIGSLGAANAGDANGSGVRCYLRKCQHGSNSKYDCNHHKRTGDDSSGGQRLCVY